MSTAIICGISQRTQKVAEAGMLVQASNPSTEEPEVRGQPGIYSKTLLQNNKEKERKEGRKLQKTSHMYLQSPFSSMKFSISFT